MTATSRRRAIRHTVLQPSTTNGSPTVLVFLLWVVVAVTAIALPLTISISGRDEFRLPKELVLRTGSILIAAILMAFAVLQPAALRRYWNTFKPEIGITMIAVGWTLVTTITSLNPALSMWSSAYVVASALFFLGAMFAVRSRSLSAVYVFLVPAVVNVLILVLQELRIWDLYSLQQASHRTALIGNPNDAGSYLLAPALAAVALVAATPARRAVHLALAGYLGAGIVLTQSLTAIGSYAAGAAALIALRSWKKAMAAMVLGIVVLFLVVTTYEPFRARAARVRAAVETGDYNTIASQRLTAFAAAAQMFTSRPLTGVGPGCFAWRYFEEKIEAEARFQHLAASGDRATMFGEVHSDYLQTLAVAGAPGALLLVGTLVFLGSLTFSHRSDGHQDPRREFSRLYSLSLAIGIAFVMVAQFPLELAASTTSILFGAAMCTAWKESPNAP